ncbi:unnamed protein product [Orchesella dallaii]|uniref:Uncharacterized protein n=1 Tax=Orchesella dallaii TaxID=48710 RepID=A0ABP1RW48_9HEXA
MTLLVFKNFNQFYLLLLILVTTFVEFSTGMDPKERACRQVCGPYFVGRPRGGVSGRFFGFKQTSGSESRESWEEEDIAGERFSVPGRFEKAWKNTTKLFGSSTRTRQDVMQFGFV